MKPRGILVFSLGLGLGIGLCLGFLAIRGSIRTRGGGLGQKLATATSSLGNEDQGTGPLDLMWRCYAREESPHPTPLFQIGDRTLALHDLPIRDQSKLLRLAEEGWMRQNSLLEDLALRLSLNQAKDETSLPELSDFAKQAAKVEDAEVIAFYQANKTSFPDHSNFDKVKPTILAHLESQKKERWIDEKRAEFKQKSTMKLLSPVSCPPRVSFSFKPFLPLGEGDSSEIDVALITRPFCLICRTLWPQTELLRKMAKGQILLRPVPVILRESEEIDIIWAKAQHCAGREGPDRLAAWLDVAHRAPLELQDQTSALTTWMKTKAVIEAQLISEDFVACLDSQDADTYADQARALGDALGVNQAPLVYVNGRRLMARGSRDGDIREALEALTRGSLAL